MAMKLISGIFILVFLVETVSSLYCYQCTNTNSWQECAQRVQVVKCSDKTIGQCLNLTLKMTQGDQHTIRYSLGCAKVCDANKNPACLQQGITCNVECCYGDYCNRLPVMTTPRPTTQEPKETSTAEIAALSGAGSLVNLYLYKLVFVPLLCTFTLLIS